MGDLAVKQAKVADAWRRVSERDRKFRLSGLEVVGKPPFNDLVIELPRTLMVLCGLNGVGKSTLMHLANEAVSGSRQHLVRDDLRGAGVLTVQGLVDGNSASWTLGADSVEEIATSFLDVSEACAGLLELVSQRNFDDLLEGVEARSVSDQEIMEIRYVLGREYESVKIQEFEGAVKGFVIDDEVVPFFTASYAGIEYTTASMGMGELAALMSLWHFWRAESQSVLFIEEPETFLSSRSTVALLDVLASRLIKQNFYAILSTHSVSALGRVPVNLVRALSLREGCLESLVTVPANRAELEHLLGVYAGQARVVLVEDRLAQIFVTELLGQFGGLWGQSVAVKLAGDEYSVRKVCETFPKMEAIRIVGVLDGDQRADPLEDANWPVIFLPGDIVPDTMLKTAALADTDAFLKELDRDGDPGDHALTTVAGQDSHDWFHELARQLGTEMEGVVRASIRRWLSIEANLAEGRALVESLSSSLTEE